MSNATTDLKPSAWIYEHDGCLETPIVTTTRWGRCDEPWTETPVFGLAGFIAARDAGLIPEVDSETWAKFKGAVDEGRAEPIAALFAESERLGLYDVPPLAELREKLGGWDVPEMSGKQAEQGGK